MIFNLPSELIEYCEHFMTWESFRNWRFVHKNTNWKIKYVKTVSTQRLIKMIKNTNQTVRQRCVHNKCSHHCLSYLSWTCGHERQFIPWCLIHTPPLILNDVDLFCMGGINEYGNFISDEFID